jgi:hypothetical protein
VAADLQGQDLLGLPLGFLGRVGELNAPGLHSAAGQNLGLDHHRTTDRGGDPASLRGCLGQPCSVTGMPALATIARDSYSKKRIGAGERTGVQDNAFLTLHPHVRRASSLFSPLS